MNFFYLPHSTYLNVVTAQRIATEMIRTTFWCRAGGNYVLLTVQGGTAHARCKMLSAWYTQIWQEKAIVPNSPDISETQSAMGSEIAHARHVSHGTVNRIPALINLRPP